MHTMKPSGLLGCPKCLRAAVFLIIAALILGGMVLIVWIQSAMADSGIALTVCGITACKPLDEDQQKKLEHGGDIILQPGNVKVIGSMPGCTACSTVALDKGVRFYVMGSPRDVACKLFGGAACTAK